MEAHKPTGRLMEAHKGKHQWHYVRGGRHRRRRLRGRPGTLICLRRGCPAWRESGSSRVRGSAAIDELLAKVQAIPDKRDREPGKPRRRRFDFVRKIGRVLRRGR